MKLRLTHFVVIVNLLLALGANAEVTLPKIFSSHMVLQRDMPIHFWGNASAGERITVEFHSLTASTTTDNIGRWSIYLPPQPAGGPFSLTIRGANTLQLDDILLGDLWFASGQSNMEMPLAGFPGNAVVQDSAKEIAAANYPRHPPASRSNGRSRLPTRRRQSRNRLVNLHPGNRQRLLRRRLLLRARSAKGSRRETTHPHRSHRLYLGWNPRRSLDQPRYSRCRSCTHARLRQPRRAHESRIHRDPPGSGRQGRPRTRQTTHPGPRLAPQPHILAPRRTLQRHGRTLHTVAHPRSHLVPGRSQLKPSCPLRPLFPTMIQDWRTPMASGQLPIPLRADLRLRQHTKRKLGTPP